MKNNSNNNYRFTISSRKGTNVSPQRKPSSIYSRKSGQSFTTTEGNKTGVNPNFVPPSDKSGKK